MKKKRGQISYKSVETPFHLFLFFLNVFVTGNFIVQFKINHSNQRFSFTELTICTHLFTTKCLKRSFDFQIEILSLKYDDETESGRCVLNKIIVIRFLI